MNKNSRGITLIALVITIIVLLILAGVTIATVLGQDGIFKKAEEAKNLTNKSNAEEEVRLAINDIFLEKEGELTMAILKAELPNKLEGLSQSDITQNADGSISFPYKGYTITIDTKYKVTANVNSGDQPPPEEDFIPISTPQQLQAIQENKNYILANDIDMTGFDWTPIITFNGILKGEGHTIKNLGIKKAVTVKGSQIMPEELVQANPEMANMNISVSSFIMLLGTTSQIENVKFTGTNYENTGTEEYKLSGLFFTNEGMLEKVHLKNIGTITTGTMLLCGMNTGSIIQSGIVGDIYVEGEYSTAEFIPENLGRIESCYLDSTIYGDLPQITNGERGTINNLLYKVTVKKNSSSSHGYNIFPGQNITSISNTYVEINVHDESTSITISLSDADASSSLTNSYYYIKGNSSTSENPNNPNRATKLTLEQTKMQASYAGFDFTNTWAMVINGSVRLRCIPISMLD